MSVPSDSSKCPVNGDNSYHEGDPIAGSLSFKQVILIVCWVCFGISVLLWLGLIIPHFRRYSAPNEQRQIFRIISTPLIFEIFTLASIYASHAAEYLEAVPSLFEAYALASLFLLYVHYVAPEAHSREEFFHNLEQKSSSGEIVHGGSLRWFRRAWRTVFFFILTYTLLFIAQLITLGTGHYCSTSAAPRHAHIWIQVLELVLTIWVLIAIIRFQRRLKDHMVGRRALLKLISFKLFVLISTLQRFIFSILKSQVKGDSKVTYQDITVGLPAMLICIEGMLFTAAFYFTFRSREYRKNMAETRSVKGMVQAFLHALNPMDLIHGVGTAFASFRRAKPV